VNSRENESCVSVIGATKIFGADEHETAAVRHISFEAYPGELALLLGPSGSGKTTLLTLMAALLKPTSGSVVLFGKNIEDYAHRELQEVRAKRIGFVFQTFLLIDSLTVAENVALVSHFAGRSRADALENAHELLARLGIEGLAGKFPQALSQGEKQRTAVARAVANEADLIIADEPTASLETSQGFEIVQMLRAYANTCNRCVVVASHDLRVLPFADRVLHIEDGVDTGERVENGRDRMERFAGEVNDVR